MLSREEIETALAKWHRAWAAHDLDGVMELFHFQDGKIIRKLTNSKTTLEIDGQRVRLLPERHPVTAY